MRNTIKEKLLSSDLFKTFLDEIITEDEELFEKQLDFLTDELSDIFVGDYDEDEDEEVGGYLGLYDRIKVSDGFVTMFKEEKFKELKRAVEKNMKHDETWHGYACYFKIEDEDEEIEDGDIEISFDVNTPDGVYRLHGVVCVTWYGGYSLRKNLIDGYEIMEMEKLGV